MTSQNFVESPLEPGEYSYGQEEGVTLETSFLIDTGSTGKLRKLWVPPLPELRQLVGSPLSNRGRPLVYSIQTCDEAFAGRWNQPNGITPR